MRCRVYRSALGALLLTVLAAGQQQAPPPKSPAPAPAPAVQEDQPTKFTTAVTVVSMAFSVSDNKKRFVTGLAKEDFDVFENGKQQTIKEFTAEPTLPLRVAILIDTSNSIRERFRFEQEAAGVFLSDLLRTNADKGMVISFDSTAQVVTGLSDDVDKLSTAIKDLRPGGGTALYDALRLASEKLSAEQPSYQFRRMIVVVSDGDDNQSRSTRDQALESVQQADAFIYAISTNNLNKGDSDGDKVMRYFAQQTGGRSFFPFQMQDLSQNFDVIAEEVRHQYNIVYTPEPLINDGQFHKVEIKVRGHKELTVRARAGYFARK